VVDGPPEVAGMRREAADK